MKKKDLYYERIPTKLLREDIICFFVVSNPGSHPLGCSLLDFLALPNALSDLA